MRIALILGLAIWILAACAGTPAAATQPPQAGELAPTRLPANVTPAPTQVELVPADVLAALKAQGFDPGQPQRISQDFLKTSGQAYPGIQSSLQIYKYPDAAAAASDAERLWPGSPGLTTVEWVDDPHFYQSGRLIILYIGHDAGVLQVLQSTLGAPFVSGKGWPSASDSQIPVSTEAPPYPPPALSPQPTEEPGRTSKDPPDLNQDQPVPYPPAVSLAIGEQRQMGAVGAYCWKDGKQVEPTCADEVGVPTVFDPLKVSSPVSAAFELPQGPAPDELTLFVSPVSASDELKGMAPGRRWWSPPSAEEIRLEPSSHPTAELKLDPGLYVLALYACWPAQGDATYGFLVEVQRSDGEKS